MRLSPVLGRLNARLAAATRRTKRPRNHFRRLDLSTLEHRVVPTGTWTQLTNPTPTGVETMLLLSDGTVMALNGGNSASKDWWRLSPDSSGSYVNGTWTDIADMSLERLFFGSAVLPDGRVMVVGGEYTGPGGTKNFSNQSEIYDPLTDSWSDIADFPATQFGDGSLMVLADGRVLGGDLFSPPPYIYDPATDSWTAAASMLYGDTALEENWVKLPDDSILTYELQAQTGTDPQRGQRYLPTLDQWVDAGNVPVPLGDDNNGTFFREMGPGILLYDGHVFYVGANQNTAIYTPPDTLMGTGSWVAGPTTPGGFGAFDAPGAVLPNGNVIYAAGTNDFNPPTTLLEYDPVANSTVVSPNTIDLNVRPFTTRMLILPSGELLFTNGGDAGDEVWTFLGDGGPDDAWRPVITGITDNEDGTFTLRGRQLNGLTEGAYYGDDAQMASNYPIIRFNQGGNVYYGRTFNWDNTGVATGATPVTAQFTLPAGFDLDDFDSIEVIANGIPSAPTQAPLVLDNTMENILIRVNPFDSNEVQILVENTVVATYDNNSDSAIIIVGSPNNNSVTVDETWGVVNSPITFDGGGDVSAPGDRMIVIGSDGDDTLNLTPSTGNSADMSFNGSRLYSFANVRKFSFNAMAGDDEMVVDSGASLLSLVNGVAYDGGTGFDRLTLTQTGGATQTSDTYTPGPNPGEGTSTIVGPSGTQVVSFQNLAPVLDLVPAASLVVNATPDSNVINYTQGTVAANGKVTIENFEPIEFSNKSALTINAQVGNDIVNLNNSATPTALTSITVNASDGDDSVTTLAGLSTAMTFNGGDGNDLLSAAGSAGDAVLNGGTGNDILVGGAGDDDLSGDNGEDILDGRGGSNTLNGGASTDTILVSGTAETDTITTNHGAGSFNITGGLSAGNNTIISMQAVRVEAGEDADDIELNLLDDGGLNYTVFGGNPIGTPLGDRLTVNSAATMTVTPGPENDAGSVDADTTIPTNVSFDEIEVLIIGGGGGGVINGTNGNDAITVIARDASTHPPADGIQDFTVVVNAGLEILFLNQPTLEINALGGSDTIVVRTPAPNNEEWDVDVTIDGGTPSAGDPSGSDRLVVETPGNAAEDAIYTPTASDGGTLDLTSLSSLLTISKIEELLYDGEADNDSLTVIGSGVDDVITHSPGSTNQSGEFQVNGLLPIDYQNLGAGGSLAADGAGGADTLVYYGTNANDTFRVPNTAGNVALNSRLVVTTTSVETLTMEGLQGDDLFDLVPVITTLVYGQVNANGGDEASATGDRTSLRTSGTGDAIGISGQVVTVGGKTVASSGVEVISLNAAAGIDVITYNGVPGTAEAINFISSGVKGQGQISVPGVTLVTFSNVERLLANGNTGDDGDEDTLTFTGTNAVDRLLINLAAVGTEADPVLKLQNASGSTTLLSLFNYTNFNTLNVKALDGNDIINVYTSATGPNRNLFVDGGAPSGKKKETDKLTVFYTPPRPHIIHSTETQDPDSGLVDLDYGSARYLVQYADVEEVVIKRL